MIPTKFLVLGLPRSRTSWTAEAFNLCNKRVFHDAEIVCRTYDDMRRKFMCRHDVDGLVSTGLYLMPYFQKLLRDFGPRVVMLERPPEEVALSMSPLITLSEAKKYYALLKQNLPQDSLVVPYQEVGKQGDIIWAYLGLGFCPKEWFYLESQTVDALRDYLG